MSKEPIIEVQDLKTQLGGQWVHKGINLSVNRGEVLAIVGGSGSGKTTLLREMLCLTKPTSGSIKIFGKDITQLTQTDLLSVQKRWGVLFQENALFSSLTLLDNVAFPLQEQTNLDSATRNQIALLKILMVGLTSESAGKLPSELSGGMLRRAGIARAIVLDPELVFLDEPTTGLDPKTAEGFDELIMDLQRTMGLTIVMITHDMDTIWRVANRVAFLSNGKLAAVDTVENLIKHTNPEIKDFFTGPRGRGAFERSHGQ